MATKTAKKTRKAGVTTTYAKGGAIAKRASKIYEGMKAEYQKDFKAAHGNSKKIKAAAADYRKKYGATARKRWGKAMKMARQHTASRQTTLL